MLDTKKIFKLTMLNKEILATHRRREDVNAIFNRDVINRRLGEISGPKYLTTYQAQSILTFDLRCSVDPMFNRYLKKDGRIRAIWPRALMEYMVDNNIVFHIIPEETTFLKISFCDDWYKPCDECGEKYAHTCYNCIKCTVCNEGMSDGYLYTTVLGPVQENQTYGNVVCKECFERDLVDLTKIIVL